jgi:hypothetical protein
MLTTPQVSLQQFSPNPVGASNATTGLIAGATNSTLSQIEGSTSSTYDVGVWYQGGGAPLIAPDVRLWPETIGREGRVLREPRPQENGLREQPPSERSYERSYEQRAREGRAREERGPRPSEEARGDWTYITGGEQAASAAPGFKKATRTYINDDTTRQNDANGTVKHDGKTEKM